MQSDTTHQEAEGSAPRPKERPRIPKAKAKMGPENTLEHNSDLKRKLIVCCDGTWKDEREAGSCSNVSMIARCITPYDRDDTPQIVYYQRGLGTGTSRYANFREGFSGKGLYESIREAYSFICHNYYGKQNGCRLLSMRRSAC
ncbi:hypothetical protein F5883DRAFT_63357 [Diaporthe sp. PMI_573]|nr:hypothetical protein F5883DRAFT_63357 [Diaporthaceae sp. PMI_573]